VIAASSKRSSLSHLLRLEALIMVAADSLGFDRAACATETRTV
jgi:hypothetical protein